MLAVADRMSTTINWLLMFHILAAVVLVAAAAAVSVSSFVALRTAAADRAAFFRQTAFRINLFAVLPAFVAVILLGGALTNKEHLDKGTPSWLDAAWTITTLAGIIGGILLSILQWWVLRRVRKGELRGWPAAVTTYTAPLILGALFVVVFLMAAKPGWRIEGPG
jgi:hypothetical protein